MANVELVSFCGLYCGECGKHKKGKCPGCAGNEKATWCKIRSCNMELGYKSCAECEEFPDPAQCSKFDNFFGTIIGFLLNSNRAAGIAKIKELGLQGFADYMAEYGRPAIRRRGA